MTRAETGPMRFADDWCGCFIRGDDALMGYAPAVRSAIEFLAKQEKFEDPFALMWLQGLLAVLESVVEYGGNLANPENAPQELREFHHCTEP